MKEKYLNILIGIVYIGLGFYVTFSPAKSLYAISMVIGSVLIIGGILNISNYFFKKSITDSNLLVGVIDLIFGLLLVTKFYITASTIIYILAVFLLLRGLTAFMLSFLIKKEDKELGNMLMVNSIFTIVFAIYFFMTPIFTILTITIMYGVFLILLGAIALISAFTLKEV